MLTPEGVDAEWSVINPILSAACKSNAVGALDITPDDIRTLATTNMCVLIVGREHGVIRVVIAIQFTTTNGHKGADIIAMGGSKLMVFKREYWDFILDWLKANECEFVDAYANDRLASVYTRKFGFDRSCVLVRRVL